MRWPVRSVCSVRGHNMSISTVDPPSDRKRLGLEPRVANRLLAAVSVADFEKRVGRLEVVTLNRGQVLFEPGDDVITTYFPAHKTMVSLLIITRDGHEIEAATIGREGAVGGIVSAGNKPAFGRAVVQIAGLALAIPTAALENIKDVSPRFGELFSRY